MALPVAAIVCIVLACWVLLVLILFGVYQLLKSRGSCDCECAPCGKEGSGGCCECCISLSDSCNCCTPSLTGCMDKICPGKKKISCVDIILCQCCAAEGEESCCLKILPSCGCCDVKCCDCSCCADCEGVTCCCLEIRLVSKKPEPEVNATSQKYVTNQSDSNNSERTAQRESNKAANEDGTYMNIVEDKINLNQKENSRPLPKSPPSSARSDSSQLNLIPKTEPANQKGAKKIKVRKMVKSISVDSPKISAGRKEINANVKKRSQRRSLPETPREKHEDGTPAKQKKSKKASSSSDGYDTDSELEEVAVRQQSVPLHRLNSNSVVRALSQGSLQSGSVSFVLSEVVTPAMSFGSDSNVKSSFMFSQTGLESNYTNDGFISQRDSEYGAGSQISIHNYTEKVALDRSATGFKQSADSTLSARALPLPSSR